METLPIEIQQHILDEIPQFTRLSKTRVAGKNYLEQLSKKDITRGEFLRFVNEYKPNSFSIISDNSFIMATRVDTKYSFVQHGLEISPTYERFFMTSYSARDAIEFLEEIQGDISFDIITTKNIYQFYRQECTVTGSILSQLVINLYNNYHFEIGGNPDNSLIFDNTVTWMTAATHHGEINGVYPQLLGTIGGTICRFRYDKGNKYRGNPLLLNNFIQTLDSSFANMMRKLIDHVKK